MAPHRDSKFSPISKREIFIEETKIAYFSAEIGISPNLPTYSGGLGVLAGDHIKASADIELPMVAVTLLYKEGYFKQEIDSQGKQRESYPNFDYKNHLYSLLGNCMAF